MLFRSVHVYVCTSSRLSFFLPWAIGPTTATFLTDSARAGRAQAVVWTTELFRSLFPIGASVGFGHTSKSRINVIATAAPGGLATTATLFLPTHYCIYYDIRSAFVRFLDQMLLLLRMRVYFVLVGPISCVSVVVCVSVVMVVKGKQIVVRTKGLSEPAVSCWY
jgi:hypothetical protein